MSKKLQKEFEAWAMPRLLKIQKILLLEHFQPIDLKYDPKSSVASCHHSYPYNSIRIYYSNQELREFKEDKKSLMGTLIHEMAHPLTDPLYHVGVNRYVTGQQIENEREKLTDHIANIVLKNGLI